MLDAHPNLYADLSIILDPDKRHMRPHETFGGVLKDEWKTLLEDHSHRLMFRTDMKLKQQRYKKTATVTKHYRKLLGQWSVNAAENIAFLAWTRILEK